MKTKIYNWLLKQLAPKYTKKQISRINEFKMFFRAHFEGWDEIDRPSDYILVKQFGITDFLYEFKDNKLIVTVVLCNPGILIGKAGRTIDSLNNYLGRFDCKVIIKESNLWKRLK